MRSSLRQIQADVKLTTAGNPIAALLGNANGEVKSLINEGTISKLILEAIGLNIGSVVATELFGARQVELNCMATDFSVKDGTTASPFVALLAPIIDRHAGAYADANVIRRSKWNGCVPSSMLC